LKQSNRFFSAAVAGARFFFGFRPRLLGMGGSPLFNHLVGAHERPRHIEAKHL
jgi:hypothetical protein